MAVQGRFAITSTMNLPLQGLRVLELGQILAGPFASSILCDLGAEVIKIERPEGDDARRMGPAFLHEDSLVFQVFNRGKQSVTLDLTQPDGREALDRLLAGSDVFLHNLRPGVAEKLKLDGPGLTARFPRLVHGEISAFGAMGPMAMQPGYEPLLQAFSGLSAINGGPDDPPMRAGASICDQGTGMWVVIGVLSLLWRRERSGQGGRVQGSLLETALSWTAQKSDALINEGQPPERHRSGHPGFAPYEAFETADEPLVICCGNDRLFIKLAQALGHPEWSSDPRFVTNRDRLANKRDLMRELIPCLKVKPRDHWLDALQSVGVPCAPVHSLAQAQAHPHVQALGMRQTLSSEGVEHRRVSLTGFPLLINGERPGIPGLAPRLGEHNSKWGLPD